VQAINQVFAAGNEPQQVCHVRLAVTAPLAMPLVAKVEHVGRGHWRACQVRKTRTLLAGYRPSLLPPNHKWPRENLRKSERQKKWQRRPGEASACQGNMPRPKAGRDRGGRCQPSPFGFPVPRPSPPAAAWAGSRALRLGESKRRRCGPPPAGALIRPRGHRCRAQNTCAAALHCAG